MTYDERRNNDGATIVTRRVSEAVLMEGRLVAKPKD